MAKKVRERSGPLQTELLGFASDGVCQAPDVTIRAVSPYLAFSPLPRPFFAIQECAKTLFIPNISCYLLDFI